MPDGPGPRPSNIPPWPPVMMAAATIIGVAAMLARDAAGGPLIPAILAGVLQIPAMASWLTRRCELMHRGTANSDGSRATSFNLYLSGGVILAAGAIAAITRRIDVALAILTLFVAGMVAIDALAAWLARLADSATSGWRLARTALAGWAAMIIFGTAILAAPLATDTAVPDYRHNFWRHVSFCAQTAASAACLVGSSGYDIGEDFSVFGRGIIYILMQVGAIGVAALAVVAMRAMTTRTIR